MTDERWFERLADLTEAGRTGAEHAPARLKSKVYSALVRDMAARGPLLGLDQAKAEGCQLCVFEQAVAALPIGEAMKQRNPCRVCHTRVLGERLEHAPIFWPGCPYSEFHNG